MIEKIIQKKGSQAMVFVKKEPSNLTVPIWSEILGSFHPQAEIRRLSELTRFTERQCVKVVGYTQKCVYAFQLVCVFKLG